MISAAHVYLTARVEAAKMLYSFMIIIAVSQDRIYFVGPQSTHGCRCISLKDHLMALSWLLLLKLSALLGAGGMHNNLALGVCMNNFGLCGCQVMDVLCRSHAFKLLTLSQIYNMPVCLI